MAKKRFRLSMLLFCIVAWLTIPRSCVEVTRRVDRPLQWQGRWTR